MIPVHTLPVVAPDRDGGWEVVFWAVCANDYTTPFRAMIAEVNTRLGGQDADVRLPPYEAYEDFIDGQLACRGTTVGVYFEHSLGYLAFFASERTTLDLILEKTASIVLVRAA